jgi:hypothetical protein
MAKKSLKDTSNRLPPLAPEDEQILAWFREKMASGIENWDDSTYDELDNRLRASLTATLMVIEDLVAHSSLEAVGLMLRLQNLFNDKVVRKAVNKALFRMKRKGVRFDERRFRLQEPPIIKEVEKKEPYGMVSAIDARGDRLLFLVMPQRPRGWAVGGGIVSDERGMVDFFLSEMSRSEIKSYFNEWRSAAPFSLIPTEARHCCFLLMECQTQMKRRGEGPPEAFLEMRPWIEQHCSPLERPIIHEFLNEQEIRNKVGLLARLDSLFAIGPFNSWIFDQEIVQRYLDKIAEVEEGRIILTSAQKVQLTQEVYRKAARELFPPERREIIRRRLEENAYVLLKEGHEQEAQIALGAALGIPREVSSLRDSDFLLKWITLSLEFWKSKTKLEENSKGGESRMITL